MTFTVFLEGASNVSPEDPKCQRRRRAELGLLPLDAGCAPPAHVSPGSRTGTFRNQEAEAAATSPPSPVTFLHNVCFLRPHGSRSCWAIGADSRQGREFFYRKYSKAPLDWPPRLPPALMPAERGHRP